MIQKINKSISIFFTEEGFGKSNAVLIDDDIRIMIDSGPGKIIEEARPGNIDILLNSHCHIDHVWNNSFFVNARIMTHPLERENFKSHKKIGSLENWEKYMSDDLEDNLHLIDTMGDSFTREWRIDDTIDDGDILDTGRTKIKIIHTPGHTSGHLSFLFPEESLLFCGDICLTKVGPWYGDSVTPVDDLITSINRIIEMNPERVVSGHNKEVLTSGISGTFIDYRNRIFMRDDRVLNSLKKNPGSLDDLASRKLIYPDHPTIFVVYWEKAMIIKHLERLMKNGVVSVDDSGIYYHN